MVSSPTPEVAANAITLMPAKPCDNDVPICEAGPSTAVIRSMSDPLPAPPLTALTAKQSAISLQTFDDAASRATWKYPRFSTATTLAETGGPGFSIEELTSTEVSEDEDAILNEPALRRRTLSRLSLQPSSIHVAPPTLPTSVSQPDRLQKATDYIKELVISVVHAIVNYVRAAHELDTKPPAERQ